ncbi:MAG: CBS domain-containing protein [Halodesulfurarchaeum sp.]
MQVRDLMTEAVVSVTASATLDEVAAKMLQYDVGSVIVMRGDVPVGIVTERDLIEAGHRQNAPFSDIRVREAMEDEFVTGSPDMTVRAAVERMNETGRKKLPIVSDFEVVGILTVTDVVSAHTDLIREAYERDRDRTRWFSEGAD